MQIAGTRVDKHGELHDQLDTGGVGVALRELVVGAGRHLPIAVGTLVLLATYRSVSAGARAASRETMRTALRALRWMRLLDAVDHAPRSTH